MVIAVESPFLLAQRRAAVLRYWRQNNVPERRRRATTNGFAEALGTSTTAVNEFENGHREDLANGKRRADYVRYLLTLEREVERDQKRRAK